MSKLGKTCAITNGLSWWPYLAKPIGVHNQTSCVFFVIQPN
jgi:hypothetical protein